MENRGDRYVFAVLSLNVSMQHKPIQEFKVPDDFKTFHHIGLAWANKDQGKGSFVAGSLMN